MQNDSTQGSTALHKMTLQNRLQCDITKNPTKIELLCKEEDNTHTTYTQQSDKARQAWITQIYRDRRGLK